MLIKGRDILGDILRAQFAVMSNLSPFITITPGNVAFNGRKTNERECLSHCFLASIAQSIFRLVFQTVMGC